MTTTQERPATEEIRIGISSCILGEKVRFDGGHKRDAYITDTLSQFVRFVPICPEVDIGLGIPRETLRLVRPSRDSDVRLRAAKSGLDHTDSMRRYSVARAREIEKLDLSGYILKSASPSCGLLRVKVYDWNGAPAANGTGIFAAELEARHPLLPIEEDGRLRDPRIRENFFERVFAYRRVRRLFSGRWKAGDVVAFHTAEKMLLLAHDPEGYRVLGRLVAGVRQVPRGEFAGQYQGQFMKALTLKATPSKHCNVLQHMQGHLKKLLGPDERAELSSLIDDFRRGLVPLVVPVTLIRHHVRAHGVKYLEGQTYLEPHPKELMLRNHV